MASSRWLPVTVLPSSTVTAMPSACGLTRVGRPGTMAMPSSVNMSARIRRDVGVFAAPRRPSLARMVTSAPKRRNIWPNSQPM